MRKNINQQPAVAYHPPLNEYISLSGGDIIIAKAIQAAVDEILAKA